MRVSEIYTSTQGEGPGVGDLTQFIRFAGCNLKCPGWPCDTPHAIFPKEYRGEWHTYSPGQIVTVLDAYPKRVTLTGGEPFIQRESDLYRLFVSLVTHGYFIEVFTNGTRPFPEWIEDSRVRIIMDWKLLGSGEDSGNLTRKRNKGLLGSKDAVKFVCVSQEDFIEAVAIYHHYFEGNRDSPQLYVGAAWEKATEAEVVEWLKRVNVPFKLNVQVHNYIWPRDQRGT
jgi:7-carboxy-7-deazaguanine synthase